jgi:hypothetical protein
MSFEKDINNFKKNLSMAFGLSIQKPIPAKLGKIDALGVKSVIVSTDESAYPNSYWFSEAGSQSFVGQAVLPPNILPTTMMRYGTPILIERDIVSKMWKISGVDIQFLSEYYQEAIQREVGYYGYENLAPGLMTNTQPASKAVEVLGASYSVGGQWKYIDTLTSVNWSVAPYNANLPASNAYQRFVMVAIDFESESLVYEYGIEVPSTMTFKQALNTDLTEGNNDILPIPDSATQFRCGYIRLLKDKPSIERFVDIFPMQDYFAKPSGTALTVADLSKIVVSNGDVVTQGGNVVTSGLL